LQTHFIDTGIQHPDIFDPAFTLCGLKLRNHVSQHGFSLLAIDRLEAALDMRASVVKMLFLHGQFRGQRSAVWIIDNDIEQSTKSYATVRLKVDQGGFNDSAAGWD